MGNKLEYLTNGHVSCFQRERVKITNESTGRDYITTWKLIAAFVYKESRFSNEMFPWLGKYGNQCK